LRRGQLDDEYAGAAGREGMAPQDRTFYRQADGPQQIVAI
jgi:hypothetical protein